MPKICRYLLSLTLFSILINGCTTDLPVATGHLNSDTTASLLGPVKLPIPQPEPIRVNPQLPSVEHKTDIKLTEMDLQKYAYELGFDPKTKLSEDQKQAVLNRKKLRQLERSLDSRTERLQYSKVLPWLNSDQEKINMLSIPSIEGRQVWINKNKIWSRIKDLKSFDDVVEAQDIALGMPEDYVRKSWGEPTHIETSGNPIYRNEKWEYLKQVATPQGYKQEKRSVYFEGGRVSGWETE